MAKVHWAERLQKINSHVLYGLLILCLAVPLFFTGLVVPTRTTSGTQTLFANLSGLKEGDTIAIESDFTLSTRGESAGQLEAIMSICRAKKIKFAIFSLADAQAPQVSRGLIQEMNRGWGEGNGLRPWEDYVELKYFPQAESISQSMSNDLRKAWQGRTMRHEGVAKPVFQSPVLQNIQKLSDFKMYIIVSASGTPKIIIQRFGNPSKVPIAACVTGVMGPEHRNYFSAGQLSGGLSVGLRDVVELETLMMNGLNYSKDGKPPVNKNPKLGVFEPIQGVSYGRGMKYFASLHTGLTLMIVMVILGNLGMIARRKRGSR